MKAILSALILAFSFTAFAHDPGSDDGQADVPATMIPLMHINDSYYAPHTSQATLVDIDGDITFMMTVFETLPSGDRSNVAHNFYSQELPVMTRGTDRTVYVIHQGEMKLCGYLQGSFVGEEGGFAGACSLDIARTSTGYQLSLIIE